MKKILVQNWPMLETTILLTHLLFLATIIQFNVPNLLLQGDASGISRIILFLQFILCLQRINIQFMLGNQNESQGIVFIYVRKELFLYVYCFCVLLKFVHNPFCVTVGKGKNFHTSVNKLIFITSITQTIATNLFPIVIISTKLEWSYFNYFNQLSIFFL